MAALKAEVRATKPPTAPPIIAPGKPNEAPIPTPVETELKPVLKADWPILSTEVISVRFLFPYIACSANPANIGPAIAIAVLAFDKSSENVDFGVFFSGVFLSSVFLPFLKVCSLKLFTASIPTLDTDESTSENIDFILSIVDLYVPLISLKASWA